MPKRSINVNNFSGGLDNNTNPRDLSDNQFKILNGLDNEIPGKLRLFGGIDAYDGFTSGSNFSQSQSTFYKGNGLTYLSFDRDVDSASKPSISQNELLLVNDAANENVYAYNLIDGSTSSALINYGSDDSRINTFVVDGEVRLSSETTKTNNTPKWFGYIEKTYNMGNNSATTAGSTNDIGHLYENYYASDLYIAPLKSSISSGSYDYDPKNYFDKSFNLGVSEIVLNDGLTLTGTDSNGDITDSNLNTVAALNTKFSAAMTLSEGHGTFALYSFFTNNSTATDLGVGATNSNIRVYSSDQKVFYGLFASNVLLGGVLNRLLLFISFVFAISATPVGLVGIIPIALLISLGELSNYQEANLAHRTTLRALIVIAATVFSGSMIFEFMDGELMGALGTLVELTNTISSLTPLVAALTIFPLSKLNQPIERIMIIYAFSLFSLMMMAPNAIMVDIYFAGLFPLAIISAVAVMDIIEQFTLDLIEHLRKLSSRFFLALSGIPIANMVLTSLYESVNNDEFFMNLMSTNLSFSSTLLIITGLLGMTISQLTMGNHSANAE